MSGSSLSMEDLDDDSLIYIFEFLGTCDRVSLQFVCKRWQELSSLLWRNFHTIYVCDDDLGFGTITEDELNFSICTQVFENSFPYLTKVNFLCTSGPQGLALVDLCLCCLLEENKSSPQTLNNLIKSLCCCENIQELALCRCIIEVHEQDLAQIFRKNRKLRVVLLSKYSLRGKCLLFLPLQTLESIVLDDCKIDLKYLDSVMYRAPQLHTVGIKNCVNGLREIELEFSSQLSSKLRRLDLSDFTPFPDIFAEICNLKNLTILILEGAVIESYELRSIVQSCKKLVVLDISGSLGLIDASLCDLVPLPELKCLNIGWGNDFSSHQLQYLSENLQELLVSVSKFSANALLKALKRMQRLEVLDVSCCMHLKNEFVKSAINIVKNRPNGVPLKLALKGTGAESDKIKTDCPKVELLWNEHFLPDYNRYL